LKMKSEQKTAIVTGGAKGIGQQVALRLAGEGIVVFIADMAEDLARQTVQMIKDTSNNEAFAVKTDVGNKADVTHLMDTVAEKFGRIDILFNSAGICSRTALEDISEDEWDQVLDINLKGTFLTSQAALPLMKQQPGGSILNMASMAGKVGGVAVGAHYSASKAGIICLTKSFAKALAPYKISVNALAPGPVETDMIQDWPVDLKQTMANQCPMGRLAEIPDVVEAAMFLLSDRAGYITGQTLNINGGLYMD
jgi:3-oxoacyl-[acyl-carrier protein] reductase